MLSLTSIIAYGYYFYNLDEIVHIVKSYKFNLLKYIKYIFNCNKCFAFWASLISFQDVVTALLISLVVYILESFIKIKL